MTATENKVATINRYALVSAYMNNQTDEQWTELRNRVAPGYDDLLAACRQAMDAYENWDIATMVVREIDWGKISDAIAKATS